MTSPTTAEADRPRRASDLVTLTIDGIEVTRAEGHPHHPRRRAARHPDPAVLRPPAARPGRRLPPVPRRGRRRGNGRDAQAAGLLHDRRSPTAWWSRPSSPRRSPRRRSTGVMELLLINHPLDCPVCDKGGECPLQNQAMSNGRGERRFHEVKRTFPKPINISSQVLLDRERCVLCPRCTRFSEQIAGDPFIDLIERGAQQQVGICRRGAVRVLLLRQHVQICPVGALTGAAYRFRSRPFDLVSAPSVCEHCASGCAHAHRPPARQGDAPAGRRRPAGQRGVELRQGPLGVHLRHRRATGSPPAGPRRATASCGRRPGPRRSSVAAERLLAARAATARRADRRPADRRGRLRVLEVRPGRARHQRHRLPGPAALRARRRTSWPPRWPARISDVTYADLEQAPAVLLAGFEPEEESPIVFLRLRKARTQARRARSTRSRRSRPAA